MADLSTTFVKFATELVKYYAEKTLGEGASGILVQELTDLVGESVTEKIKDFLDQGELTKQVIEAFNEADNCFSLTIDDDVLKQAIISKPLAGLEQWDVVAKQIPSTLNDTGLLTLIRTRFEKDWPGKLTNQQLDRAAMVYRDCLDRSLATKLNQILPTLFRKVERIDLTSREILENQLGLRAQIREVDKSISRQSDDILRLSGITTRLLVQNIHIPLPDSLPLQPKNYINRVDFQQELLENLLGFTWLALVDGPGKGKTQQALLIYNSYHDPLRCWISLRNRGDLVIKHFRDQMVRWLIQLTGQPAIWLLYQTGNISFADIIDIMTESLGENGLLVADDLPDPTIFDDLYDELEIVVEKFSGSGSKVVTTSQWALPPLLNVHLPSKIAISTCPYFTTSDIQDFLNSAHIAKEIQNENIAIWITALTKGHPILVAATIGWLEQQGSQISLNTYDGLITGEPVKDTLEYNRKLLLRALDSSSKSLLYRLSIIGEKFGRELVVEVADIHPTILNPGETLEKLIGPWLDRSTDDFIEVSPLLANSGRDNLPFEVQREIHLLVAEQYLRERIIDSSEANTILVHLWQAHDYMRFATTLIQLLLSAETRAQAKYIDWACALVYDVDWPDEINLGFRIMIRAAQVRTLALAGGKYKKINDDLELLLSQANMDEEAPAIIFAYVNAGILSEELPVEITIPRSFEVIRLINKSSLLDEVFSSEILEHLPNAVWSQGMGVKDRDQIKLFIENFISLPESDRNSFVEASFALEVSTHMMDQSWYSEASKPQEQRDWQSVLSFLDEIYSYPYIQNTVCFEVAIARSRAVIYADYLKQIDKAIELLDALPQLTNPDALFLVDYSKGCFASEAGNSEQAVIFFVRAENTRGSGYSFYRLDNTKRLAIETSRHQDWTAAKALLINVIHRFWTSEGKALFTWERLELFGELAFIHWSNGDLARACGAMYGFVMGLVIEKDVDNSRYREAFNKAGHGLVWFVAVSGTGRPPSATLNGGEYTPVQAGLFGIRRERLGDFVSPVGFSKAILLTQLGMFAGASGLTRMSWKIYKLALEYYRREDKLDSLRAGMMYDDLASLEAMFGDPSESLGYAVQAKKFLAVGKVLYRKKEEFASSVDLTMDVFLSEVTEEDYQTAERHLFYVVFSPLLSYMLGANLNKTEISARLALWEKAIVEEAPGLLYMDEWSKAIQLIDDLVQFWKEGEDIDPDLEVFGDKTILELFWYLLSSAGSNIKLKEAFSYQVSAIITLPQYGQFARYMLPGIGKFIHRYWLAIAQTRRFALRNPQQFLDNLLSTSPNQGGATLAHVLKSAGQALGVNIPSDAREKLDQVKNISMPWDFKSDLSTDSVSIVDV
jgi:tetratricopeptide (TPR) repeat protein